MQYLTIPQKITKLHLIAQWKSTWKKHLEKKQHTLFLCLFYRFCHFLKLRAVKTLSEQFPESQSF